MTPKCSGIERGAERGASPGMTLIELLVAAALSALLILGLVTIASATSAASIVQRNHAQINDNARFAMKLLVRSIRQAGFNPEPWNESFAGVTLTDENRDGGGGSSDRLAVRTWSDRNCFDNRNPDLDEAGVPLFYIRESVFDLTGANNLAHRCSYGPSLADLTNQIPRQGLVPGIESFQVLYGEDADDDGDIERWVAAGEWADEARILGVRIGLLAAGEDAVREPGAREFDVLGVPVSRPGDGKLRRVFHFAAAIRGRAR
jgi:type IV pilus assembly protein PilW